MNIKIVKISDIKIGSRNRQYKEDKTRGLAKSIQEIGLLHPIVVSGDNMLIAGLHRLKAAEMLGWEEIPASVTEFSTLEKELSEIDENLIRSELTELEKSDLLARAKEIYEIRHPETVKANIVKKNLKQFSGSTETAEVISVSSKANYNNELREISTNAFTDSINLGLSSRSIRQSIQISNGITPEVKDIIKNTAIADSKTELLSLARIEPEKQLEVVGILKNGNAKKVKEAIYQVRRDEFTASIRKAEQATNRTDLGISTKVEVFHGDVFRLGENILICGDNSNPAVIEYLTQFHFSFSFADPPYNLGIANYDKENFVWTQDYLTGISDIVAVTPGVNNIQSFFKKTEMAYKWLLICHAKNLHSGCAIGYTHYYPIFLFTNLRVANFGIKDLFTITLPPMPTEDKDIAFKRQKPAGLLTYLLNSFSNAGDLILDPFAGSGQTLMISEALGRKCVTVEILPEMIEKIINRYEGKFKIKAVKINTL